MHTLPGTLLITRHQESDWNKAGLWTGTRDRHLTEFGFKRAEEMGNLIHDIHIDLAFCSMKVRTIETLASILESKQQYDVPTVHSHALDERDYGDYTKKNKWDMLTLVGEEKWEAIRRGWNTPIPNGETLEMVYERAVPFFISNILPPLENGKNVLLVAHGNTLRALTKYIESLSDDEITRVEIVFEEIIMYKLNNKGKYTHKEIRKIPTV